MASCVQKINNFQLAMPYFHKEVINAIPFLNLLKAKADQRDSNIASYVGPARPFHGPGISSAGIAGQLPGSRDTRVRADDNESANNSATDA